MSRKSAIITLLVTLAIAWGSLAATLAGGWKPLLGLDLQGGFSVVLEAPPGTDSDLLDKAVEIMRRRIEALGNVQEPEIAVLGANQIEVQLPGVTDRDRALAAVGTTGQLEFRPVLDALPGFSPVFTLLADVPLTDDQPVIDFSTTTTTSPSSIFDTTTTTATGGTTTTTVAATTTTIGAPTTTVAGGSTDTTTTTTATTVPPGNVDPKAGVILPDGVTWCDEVDQPGCVDPATGLTPHPVAELEAFLATEDGLAGFVYRLAPVEVDGGDLDGASAQFQGSNAGITGGSIGGEWVVVLEFNDVGADRFTEVTKTLAGYPLGDPRRQFAIVLDGVVQSAPQVASTVDPNVGISGGSAVITLGSAQDQESEAQELSIVLRYGSLPAAFEQIDSRSVSATLGSDSLRAGLIAGIGGLLLVAVGMILYYRALGLINVIGLSVFGSLLIVIYSILGRWQGVTLTLAGVAGVIVAIGITSDSYIVYFERIKEEVHRGRSLRSAIDHAFKRSFRTILTADTVSFFGAALLFFLAVGSVKGFALALGLATVLDVVVAVFFTKPAVSLVARTRLGDGGALSIRGATGLPKEEGEAL
jgi:preprotein translocase subunit SecD